MIGDLQPYREYKESGSRRLAKVLSHWEVRNLRTLIRPRNERDRVDLPLLSVAREKGVFVRSLTDANENHNVIPEDLSNYKVARAGNLVVAHVEDETKTLKTAINRLEREIDFLREYRTRLVADVATGKLDIREVARHLPSEVAETESIISNEIVDDEPVIEGEEAAI